MTLSDFVISYLVHYSGELFAFFMLFIFFSWLRVLADNMTGDKFL